MALDVTAVLSQISEGQAAAIVVALAFAVAMWALKAVKLLRDDGSAESDGYVLGDDLGGVACPECGVESPWDELEEDHHYQCGNCGAEMYDAEGASESERDLY